MLGCLSQEVYLRGWGAYWCITGGDTPEDGTLIGVPAKWEVIPGDAGVPVGGHHPRGLWADCHIVRLPFCILAPGTQ